MLLGLSLNYVGLPVRKNELRLCSRLRHAEKKHQVEKATEDSQETASLEIGTASSREDVATGFIWQANVAIERHA